MANSEEDKSDTDQIFIQKKRKKKKSHRKEEEANNIIFFYVYMARRPLDLFWQD